MTDTIDMSETGRLDKPQMLKRDPLVVTQSDLRLFKTCRRSWWLRSYLGLDAKEKQVVGPLTLGSRVHAALEQYYGYGHDLVEAYTDIARAELEQLEESGIMFSRRDWENETELGRIMLEGYGEYLEETGADADYEVIGAEKKLVWPIEVDGMKVELRGKIDLRIRNTFTGARLVLDHKTTAHFSNLTITAHLDEQLLFYMLLERLAESAHPDDWVEGAVFNMLRKVRRSGSASPPFYQRLQISHSDMELRQFYQRVWGELQDYVRVVRLLDAKSHPTIVAYPTPGTQCRYCPFRGPCPLFDDGSRVDEMIDSMFIQNDPHARYFVAPATLLDEIAAN